MNLEIITPDKKVFDGEATSVIFPGSEGEFQELNNHAPIVTSLGNGTMTIEANGQKQSFVVDGGVVEVLNNNVLVLAEAIS